MTALLYIVAPMIAACIISFILGACWAAGRADEETERYLREVDEVDRVILHGETPWNLTR